MAGGYRCRVQDVAAAAVPRIPAGPFSNVACQRSLAPFTIPRLGCARGGPPYILYVHIHVYILYIFLTQTALYPKSNRGPLRRVII